MARKSFWLFPFSTAKTPPGGYNYQFVKGPPSDEYKCLVCTLVAREAQQASCCGKIFCKGCLDKWTITTRKCPNCKEYLQNRYFPDRRADRNIKQMKVYCDNKEKGCEWAEEIHHAEAHHDSCPYRAVTCPNMCTKSIKSMDLPKHLETHCPNRKTQCTHCGQSGKYHHISTDHLEKCPDLKIDCPNNGCNKMKKRKDLKDHRQECVKEIISCEYATLGCKHVCLREDMLQHNRQQVHTHLQLATKETMSTKEEAGTALKEVRSAAKELRIVRILLESRAASPQKHVFKMSTFSKHKECAREWESPPFYTFPGGYNMRLKVYSEGYGVGKGTHISFFLYLMEGENDEILEWPMRGEFTIELLNQERDENHKQQLVAFAVTRATEYNSKVREGCEPGGYGIFKFVSHEDLEEKSLPPHTKYLKDDTLYFRVTMTKMESKSKPWLAGAVD